MKNVINNLPIVDDWLDSNFIKDNNYLNWNESISKLHYSTDSKKKI